MKEQRTSFDLPNWMLLPVLWCTVLLFLGVVPWGKAASPLDRASLRSGALDDLFVLRDHRAGKNSFVESPETPRGHVDE